ncbi:Cytochrome P450 94A2 [Apostasia shenzhenica]|uniref:noroxomaritidine synthase n=1 Tax=Apostasia shenzhenica TaxID=1088818 RepID=A0A2I0B2F9_9ASPA|nr:Cytochrome P450 94A2 [Apostasia shenzhenica]
MEISASFLSSSLVLLLVLLLSLTYLLCHRPKNRAGGPPAKARQFVVQGRPFLDWSTDLLLKAPAATVAFPGGRVLTASPAVIEHILKTNFDNYPKGSRSNSSMADLLGDGIFNTDGHHWQIQRRIASLGFNNRSLRRYLTDVFHPEINDRLLPFLSRAAASGSTIDLQNLLERFAFDVVCRVGFGFDPALLVADAEDAGCKGGGRFARAYESALALILSRWRPHLWRIPRYLRIGNEAWLREELAILDDFAVRIVEDAKKTKKKNTATAESLIAPFIEAGGLSDRLLRDVVLNYVLAGRDTTSAALTWFFYLLSSQPAVRQRIFDEILAVRAKSGGSVGGMFDVEELKDMEYLHAAITETMRLYPPVPLDARSCAGNDVLPGGMKVKKGWSVNYNMYTMGRSEEIWGDDCREFRPERWLDREGAFQPESPFRFPIFYAGPRMCLGKEMAYMQMKAAAGAMVERFEFEVVGEELREHETVAVLRMKGGLPVRVTEVRRERVQ